LNRRTRFCRPLRNHSATTPSRKCLPGMKNRASMVAAGAAARMSPESADAGRQVYGTTLAEGKEESHKNSNRPSVLLRHPVKPEPVKLESAPSRLRVGLTAKASRERLAFHQRAKVDLVYQKMRGPFGSSATWGSILPWPAWRECSRPATPDATCRDNPTLGCGSRSWVMPAGLNNLGKQSCKSPGWTFQQPVRVAQ
jgi:hypothetical protein